MATYIESGLGKATSGNGIEMGQRVASQVLSQLGHFEPTLALLFVSPELNIQEVRQGVLEALSDCRRLGASIAGEIANGLVRRGVVVCVIASPHLMSTIGMGRVRHQVSL
jgi:hypothetical protein